MSTSVRKWLRECVGYAGEQGLAGARVVYGGVHPRLVGEHRGRVVEVVIPRSEASPRHRRHFRTQLRRLLRAERHEDRR